MSKVRDFEEQLKKGFVQKVHSDIIRGFLPQSK